MTYRAGYLAVALSLGTLLSLAVGALEKQRFAEQAVADPQARPDAGVAASREIAAQTGRRTAKRCFARSARSQLARADRR